MALLLLAICALAAADFGGFVNLSVDREVELEGRYVHVVSTVEIANQGEVESSKYFYALSQENWDKMAHLRIFNASEPFNHLKCTPVQHDGNGYVIVKVQLLRSVKPGGLLSLVFHETLAEKTNPFPKAIGIYVRTIQDKQFLWYEDNIHFFSPYPTSREVIKVNFPNSDIESYTRPLDELYDLEESKLTYGPYEGLKPFTNSTVKLHYEHSVSLPYFSYVERQIEISHWGNIAVNEFYAIENRGAALKGEFNRVDFSSRARPSALNALEDLEAILPQSAYGLYYRDDIGNVSSSNARKHSSYVHLEIQPRFPMMGGWKNKFYIGYSLPLKYFVKSNDEVFMLNSTFGAPFQGVISEELVVKVILPEGATLKDVVLPFDVEEQSTEKIYSYLDTAGRTVLVLKKKNAVDFHRKPFQVIYTYSSSELLKKPLILSGYAFVVLLGIVWGLTASKNKAR